MTAAVPLLLAAVLSGPGTIVDWPSTSSSYLYRIENRWSGRYLNTEKFSWDSPVVGLNKSVPESWWSSYWSVSWDPSNGKFKFSNRWKSNVSVSCFDYDTEWNLNSQLTLEKRTMGGVPCIRISCDMSVDDVWGTYHLNNENDQERLIETRDAPSAWWSACWVLHQYPAF